MRVLFVTSEMTDYVQTGGLAAVAAALPRALRPVADVRAILPGYPAVLRGLRSTIFSVWLAYSVVWMAYGLRLISSTLLQVAPELEEAARSTGATRAQITRHVTIPLARYGLIGSWLLMFLIFEREYSTGVYLLSPGTETIGSMLVSLWASGAIDIVAALSFINIVLVVAGLGVALRFGVKLHD